MKEGEASEERTSAFKTQQQGGPGLKVGGARETSHSPLLYQLEKATASSSLCDSLFFPFALFSPKLGRRSVKEKGDGLKRDDKWQPPSSLLPRRRHSPPQSGRPSGWASLGRAFVFRRRFKSPVSPKAGPPFLFLSVPPSGFTNRPPLPLLPHRVKQKLPG